MTNRKPLTVAFYGGVWPTNIGNGFIDLGAMSILRAAMPGARISFVGASPRWLFGYGAQPLPVPVPSRAERAVNRLMGRERPSPPEEAPGAIAARMDTALDMALLIETDLIVVGGMVMSDEFITTSGPTLLRLAERGVPTLFLGAGAEFYTEAEKRQVFEFIRKLQPLGFISRDRPSYERFSSAFARNADGLDCGFFAPDAHVPPSVSSPPYIALTFDSGTEPPIDPEGKRVVRAHHLCWGPIVRDWITADTLISFMPEDYLTLYAHAEATHSDRVHACVAALAYGRKARLYSGTPRAALFETAGAPDVQSKLVALDIGALQEKKAKQIETVRAWTSDYFKDH